MSLRRSLGMRGLPTGRDFQRQRRRNPLRCQRTKVSGRTFTRASRHANRRPRITLSSRVESSARCGYTFRSRNRASGLRRKRFSLASVRRDLETSTRRRTRSHATEDNVLRLCVSGWKTAPRMNDQLYTLLDVTRLPIGGWAKFLRTTRYPYGNPSPLHRDDVSVRVLRHTAHLAIDLRCLMPAVTPRREAGPLDPSPSLAPRRRVLKPDQWAAATPNSTNNRGRHDQQDHMISKTRQR